MAGAKVEAQDIRGFTPLHYAVELGDAACCQQLLTPVKNEEITNMKSSYQVQPPSLPQDMEITNEYGKYKYKPYHDYSTFCA